MSDEQIIKYPHSIIASPCEDFNFDNPPGDPKDLSLGMMQIMNDCNAVGLSANQLGIPYRVFVMRNHPENFVCFNPRIVNYSDEQVIMEEACLSFPGVNVKIKRPKSIRVRFQVPSGQIVTSSFEGLTARIFQHEMDHLDGALFFNRANRYHRDKAMKGYYNGK
jgi:peptide deformylase